MKTSSWSTESSRNPGWRRCTAVAWLGRAGLRAVPLLSKPRELMPVTHRADLQFLVECGVSGHVVGKGPLGEREDAAELVAEFVGANLVGGDGLAPRLAAFGPHDRGPLLVAAGLPGVEVGIDPSAVAEEIDLGAFLGWDDLVGGHASEAATEV